MTVTAQSFPVFRIWDTLDCRCNMGIMELKNQNVDSWQCLVIWVLKLWQAFGRDCKYYFAKDLNYWVGGAQGEWLR